MKNEQKDISEMLEKQSEAKCKKEYRRINKLLIAAGIKDEKIKILQPIIENTAWMKVRLDEARKEVRNSQIVVAYDNGGNQKGIRENPIYKGYEALWKSYMQGMSKIIDAIPEEKADVKKEECEHTLTMLDVVRARKKA